MPFECPRCNDLQSMEIVTSIQLPKGRCMNEITLQIVECGLCKFSGLAVYEEGRRGAVDTRAWRHTGYQLEISELRIIKKVIMACPNRMNPSCECPAHLIFGACDAHGEWLGLENIDPRGRFPMHLSL
jgi:hypothetical protein